MHVVKQYKSALKNIKIYFIMINNCYPNIIHFDQYHFIINYKCVIIDNFVLH